MDNSTQKSLVQPPPATTLDLSDRTCLVTGASRGIGAAIALQLSACGARVVVNGGHQPVVDAAARAVANSPLVKAALHGGDPNWGRIAQAVGGALPGTAPLPLDIWIEDVQVCGRGAALPYDAAALGEAVGGTEVEYTVGLPGEGADTEVFFSDLSHDYVTINAEYTT